MNTDATKPKKKKVQGRLDREMIFELYTQKNPPTKKEIAERSGSLATTVEGKINGVNSVVKSSEFQMRLEALRNKQNERALRWIKKAEEKIDLELFAKDPAKLASFKMANEKILQENLKSGIQMEVEKVKSVGMDNLTTEEIETKLAERKRKIELLEQVIEGELVE